MCYLEFVFVCWPLEEILFYSKANKDVCILKYYLYDNEQKVTGDEWTLFNLFLIQSGRHLFN